MVTSSENINSNELEGKIISQVEYYFGDLNLKQDKFMKYQMSQNDGWFPLEKLITFNRLKNLTTDQVLVIDSLKKSTSGLIEVSECGTKLRRIKPLPEESEEYLKCFNTRTLHLKGFPKESVLDEIKEFCSTFGKVESIQMRRNLKKNGEFKGCIFVTYENVDDANKALDSELKYNDIELLKENKEKYFERKKNYYDSLKKKKALANDDNLVQTEGAILKVVGLKAETKFSEIKEELNKYSKVAFVSSVNDQLECSVRFSEKDGAKVALSSLKEQTSTEGEENKVSLELCGQKVEIALATDEEEKQFWREFKSKQAMSGKKNRWQKGKKRRFNDNGNYKNKSFKSSNE